MLDIARQHQITIPYNITRLSELVQVQEGEPYTYQNFLATPGSAASLPDVCYTAQGFQLISRSRVTFPVTAISGKQVEGMRMLVSAPGRTEAAAAGCCRTT